MRNLLRAAAVCALTLTALSTVEAATFGNCLVRCYAPGSLPTSVSTYTTKEDCCGVDHSNLCPPGYSGVGAAWNNRRC